MIIRLKKVSIIGKNLRKHKAGLSHDWTSFLQISFFDFWGFKIYINYEIQIWTFTCHLFAIHLPIPMCVNPPQTKQKKLFFFL